jgi:hypothetical protein
MIANLYQEVFDNARGYIHENYGLDLSLIELVHLKNDYVKPSTDTMPSLENWWGGHPVYVKFLGAESAARFLSDYYGVPINDKRFIYTLSGDFYDKLKEYLKLIQESAHLL